MHGFSGFKNHKNHAKNRINFAYGFENHFENQIFLAHAWFLPVLKTILKTGYF
jgi:hypothetical protein